MYFKKIKDLREDNDLKQENIANYLKITRQQYGLYETGKRTIPIDLLIKLAKYYDTSIDYIVDLKKKKKKNKKKNIERKILWKKTI